MAEKDERGLHNGMQCRLQVESECRFGVDVGSGLMSVQAAPGKEEVGGLNHCAPSEGHLPGPMKGRLKGRLKGRKDGK